MVRPTATQKTMLKKNRKWNNGEKTTKIIYYENLMLRSIAKQNARANKKKQGNRNDEKPQDNGLCPENPLLGPDPK